MAANMNSMDDAVFFIKRYARLATPFQIEEASMTNENVTTISEERWIYHDTGSETIKLSISKQSQLVLQKGGLILENFSLMLATENIRVIAKGDSILVVCKAEDQIKKFRLQFGDENDLSGMERCQQCLKLLCSYVQIKRTYSQANGCEKDSSPSHPLTTHDITESGSDSTSWTFPGLGENLDQTQIEEEIVRCILDVNFLPLVNRVEKCLLQL